MVLCVFRLEMTKMFKSNLASPFGTGQVTQTGSVYDPPATGHSQRQHLEVSFSSRATSSLASQFDALIESCQIQNST